MEPSNVRIFRDRAAFRTWLEKHHDSETEVWVGHYRKGVTKRAVSYPDAVEEALCFGWIDGQMRGIDAELRAQRYSPRRRASTWSATNIAKVAVLRAAGRMHPAGIRAFEERDRRKDATYAYEREPLELDAAFMKRLRADLAAWAHWEGERPSFRRLAADWVMSAKRVETRQRRFDQLLTAVASGSRPTPFLVSRSERS